MYTLAEFNCSQTLYIQYTQMILKAVIAQQVKLNDKHPKLCFYY